jgi:hypothetical protein
MKKKFLIGSCLELRRPLQNVSIEGKEKKWFGGKTDHEETCQKNKSQNSGLPDGTYIFKPKMPNLGKILEGLANKMLVYFMPLWSIFRPFGMFFGHLVCFWPFGIFYGHLVYFPPFWYNAPRKIWQPWSQFWLVERKIK